MIQKLWLHNFRNYDSQEIAFNSERVVFSGANGQGKSNLIEAIFFLSMLRSFRTSRVSEIKKFGSSGFFIGLQYWRNSWLSTLEIEHSGSGVKKLLIDNQPVYRSSDFIRRIKTVIFAPNDIEIVTGASRLRRRFVDILISVNDASYMNALHNYNRALRSRNSLLKNPAADSRAIEAFEPIMAELSSVIIARREEYSVLLRDEMEGLLKNFYGGSGLFEVSYKNSFNSSSPDKILARFASERERERRRGFTLCGPHLDDFEFYLKGVPLRNFGSTGQCRLVSLCLKMAQMNIMLRSSSQNDIIALIDDVYGNLDNRIRELFNQTVSRAGQIFYTFTDYHGDDNIPDAEIFYIKNGKCAKFCDG